MARLEPVPVNASKHGVSVPEYLLLQMVSAFVTTADDAVAFLTKMLAKTPCADTHGLHALRLCAEKGWVTLSEQNFVQLTEAGAAMLRVIRNDPTAPPEPGS